MADKQKQPAGGAGGASAFEAIRHEDADGGEYSSARELAKVLGYADRRNFVAVIGKAREACENSQYAVADHFVDATELIETGKTARRHHA